MATNTEPRVRTYSDAFKLSTSIPAAQLLDLIEANGNPVIYRPRCQARIAFSINIFGRFIGYEYCNRAGYTQADTVDLFAYSGGRKQPVVFHLESKGDRAPESGYFHAGTSQIHQVVEDSLVSHPTADDRTELQKALQDLRDLDDRLGTRGSLIDDCRENLTDVGDPEPEILEATEEERAAWIRRLIASVESELDADVEFTADEDPVEVPVGFPGIRAWGHHLGSLPSFIEDQEAMASADGAPANAIFKRSRYDHDRPGQWQTISEVTNPTTLSALRSRLGDDLFTALVEMGPVSDVPEEEIEVPEEEIAADDLISVDGIDLDIDRRSAIVRQVLAAAEKLLFSEINGGPRRSVEEIEGLTFYVTADRADVDAASYAPVAARGRHGWIRFHFDYPIGISYVEMVDRLAPGEYAPELICPGDLVSIPGKTDAVRVAKVVDYHGRQTKPIEIHLENGGVIGTTYLADGGLIELR